MALYDQYTPEILKQMPIETQTALKTPQTGSSLVSTEPVTQPRGTQPSAPTNMYTPNILKQMPIESQNAMLAAQKTAQAQPVAAAPALQTRNAWSSGDWFNQPINSWLASSDMPEQMRSQAQQILTRYGINPATSLDKVWSFISPADQQALQTTFNWMGGQRPQGGAQLFNPGYVPNRPSSAPAEGIPEWAADTQQPAAGGGTAGGGTAGAATDFGGGFPSLEELSQIIPTSESSATSMTSTQLPGWAQELIKSGSDKHYSQALQDWAGQLQKLASPESFIQAYQPVMDKLYGQKMNEMAARGVLPSTITQGAMKDINDRIAAQYMQRLTDVTSQYGQFGGQLGKMLEASRVAQGSSTSQALQKNPLAPYDLFYQMLRDLEWGGGTGEGAAGGTTPGTGTTTTEWANPEWWGQDMNSFAAQPSLPRPLADLMDRMMTQYNLKGKNMTLTDFWNLISDQERQMLTQYFSYYGANFAPQTAQQAPLTLMSTR